MTWGNQATPPPRPRPGRRRQILAVVGGVLAAAFLFAIGAVAGSAGSDDAKAKPAATETVTVTATPSASPPASPHPAVTVTVHATRTVTATVTAGSDGGGGAGDGGVYYKNCAAARAAGAAPLFEGDPGYGRHLDRDGDGVACE